MLDLFAGLGGASSAMIGRGWSVVTVDNDSRFGCTHTADLTAWSWPGATPDLIWASPPCTEFSRESMPWCRTGTIPSLVLVSAAMRIIAECQPRWWVIENVRGAVKFWGPPIASDGRTWFLWGFLPGLPRSLAPRPKDMRSGGHTTRAAIRARIPPSLARLVAETVTTLVRGGA